MVKDFLGGVSKFPLGKLALGSQIQQSLVQGITEKLCGIGILPSKKGRGSGNVVVLESRVGIFQADQTKDIRAGIEFVQQINVDLCIRGVFLGLARKRWNKLKTKDGSFLDRLLEWRGKFREGGFQRWIGWGILELAHGVGNGNEINDRRESRIVACGLGSIDTDTGCEIDNLVGWCWCWCFVCCFCSVGATNLDGDGFILEHFHVLAMK